MGLRRAQQSCFTNLYQVVHGLALLFVGKGSERYVRVQTAIGIGDPEYPSFVHRSVSKAIDVFGFL